MKNKKNVVAILTSDWHLSHHPPVWRSAEPDWYEAMKRPLEEIEELRSKHHCPILCAGDIYNKWNSPAELINFAINQLSNNIFSIPGQHDLPEHSYYSLYRSAYETLVRANKIEDLPPETSRWMDSDDFESDKILRVSSFPFDVKLKQSSKSNAKIELALIHEYCCSYQTSFPRAPEESHIKWKRANEKLINGKLYDYDVIVYGDNHKGFLTKVGKTTIFNCGTLMRRKSDEMDYKPQVGLLYSDGSVEPHYLDTSQDKYLTAEQTNNITEETAINMKEFGIELAKLGDSDLNFKEAWKRYCQMNKIKKPIKDIVWNAMTGE